MNEEDILQLYLNYLKSLEIKKNMVINTEIQMN